jgi:Uma2 family endonuclease
MGTTTLISLEEYLNTHYDPDCDYVDGHIGVVAGPRPDEKVFTRPPFACIEVLSESDSIGRLQARLDDYLNFGVPNIWVIDPVEKRAWAYSATGLSVVKDRVLRAANPDIAIPLDEIFAEME